MMDIYQSTLDYISSIPVLKNWPEVSAILSRTASMQPGHWLLPLLACEAVGGSVHDALPVVAALACLQVAILMVDDMLDEDPRGEYHRLGEGQAANIASALLSAGMEAILCSKARSTAKLMALQSLNQMILTTAFGQYLDSQNLTNEPTYWRVVETKSVPFFGTALYLGALFGGAADEVAEGLERFGKLYGEMIQIYDDIHDCMDVPANPDWRQGRKPLPILFAQSVDHPDRSRFLELCKDISVHEALQEAQNILIRCGAISYCVHQLLRRHQAAREILSAISLLHREEIDSLAESAIAPVWKLFEEMGKPTVRAT